MRNPHFRASATAGSGSGQPAAWLGAPARPVDKMGRSRQKAGRRPASVFSSKPLSEEGILKAGDNIRQALAMMESDRDTVVRVPERLRLSVLEKTIGLKMPNWKERWPADVQEEFPRLWDQIVADRRFLGRLTEAEEFFSLVLKVIELYNGDMLKDGTTHKAAHSLGAVRHVQELAPLDLPFEKLLRRMQIALLHDIMEDLKHGRKKVLRLSNESVAAGVRRMSNLIPKGEERSLEQYVGYLIGQIYERNADGAFVDEDVIAAKKGDRLDLLGRLAHLSPDQLERQKNKCRHHLAVSLKLETPSEHYRFYWKAQRVLQASLPLNGQTFEQAFMDWLGDKPAPLD